jgi:hypothetical protein
MVVSASSPDIRDTQHLPDHSFLQFNSDVFFSEACALSWLAYSAVLQCRHIPAKSYWQQRCKHPIAYDAA